MNQGQTVCARPGRASWRLCAMHPGISAGTLEPSPVAAAYHQPGPAAAARGHSVHLDGAGYHSVVVVSLLQSYGDHTSLVQHCPEI